MVRTVKHARLESPSSRARLKAGRQPHWQALAPNGVHLGYVRRSGEGDGKWLLRRYLGGGNSYRVTTIARADDKSPANGKTVLNFDQAHAAARAMADVPDGGKIQRLTVRKAMELYVEHKRALGQSVADVVSRGNAHILPPLGDVLLTNLTAERLRKWLFNLAESPAQKRPTSEGKPQYFQGPKKGDDEAIRRRRSSANRVMIMLKAILNHAFDEGHVNNRDAWGRKFKPFKGVAQARVRYLSIAECVRLLNACDADFRALVRAALETGARYSELARLEVADLNPDAGNIAIRKSKTSKARYVQLTDEGNAFFVSHCAGKKGDERMFNKAGAPWVRGGQDTPMKEAVARAKIAPRITFHGLRHTWASLAVMNDMPLLLVARNLGHANTKHVEATYGHLAPGYITDTIKATAPKYGIAHDNKVAPLRS